MLHPWTGAEVRSLRNARRMSLRDFAAHLGVGVRLVSKWESGGADIKPRAVNQAALDTSLQRLDPDEELRFVEAVDPAVLGEVAPEADVVVQPDQVRHPVDGTWMSWIPGSVYLSGPQSTPTWVEGFFLDVYPVTNADYSRFVAATDHRPPQHWESSTPPTAIADHPVVWVSHDDATSYARWAHKQLPSAGQWEKAARGTSGGTWPWGSQPTPAKGNFRGVGPGATTPVDRYKSGVSPFGISDMCGNCWEWTSSPTTPGRYELKGSAFTSPFDRCRPEQFNDAGHTMLDDDTGFRCATVDLKA
ncbi:SUMF1/EgtB/PvdO family nonheme iron enzyme [Nocardia noduli]|uniref:SUMF1/EgtB/PvdO family nonheme iron enzyme n=1 Tax=Nocardia noduli TaxID=2815722 RepID=UPI001C244D0C|nr:SUMF1/EgtB/PvdO family nonheme iron enzyme [Nocardia noduli]